MTIIDDYLEHQERFVKEYGENTIVLMQVGHFFESYGLDNDKERSNADNLYRLCDIMNIQLTRKNKNIKENSRKNPLMIGVNLYSIDKYIQILLNANYTTVLIEQTSPPPDPDREITNIYSPGINMCHKSGDSSNFMSIYMETSKNMKNLNDLMYIGMSSIDLSTGKNKIFETFSKVNDKNLALDEAFRFIQICDPKEILIYKKDIPLNNHELSGYLDLQSRVVHFKEIEDLPKEFNNINYQKAFLEKVFKNTGLLSVIEYIDCETKPFGLLSYISLLDFAYKHNEKIILKIDKPEICQETNQLILTNNTINQLNLVSHPSQNVNMKYNSLFAVINNTSTSIGRRLLKERLLNPITNINELRERYDITEAFTNKKQDKPLYLFTEECLKKIIDIERLHRRLGLKMLQPADFGSLDVSYNYINEMIVKIQELDDTRMKSLLPKDETLKNFRLFIEEYTNDLNLDVIVKYHMDKITNNFFNKNVIEELDLIQNKIDYCNNLFVSLAEKLSNLIDPNGHKLVKCEYNELRGHHLVLTTKRCQILKKRFQNMNYSLLKFYISDGEHISINPKDFIYKGLNSSKTSTVINSDLLDNCSHKLISYTHKIQSLCLKHYLQRCEYYYEKYNQCLREIVKFVGEVDFYKSSCKTATIYGYKKPTILENDSSFLIAKSIRHPIIERIQTSIEYVPNDVYLGKEKEKEILGSNDPLNDPKDTLEHGMLLYGTNASGKSSLMKALGLNIIMAQAGLYVSCEKLNFCPYTQLFSRINNNDNIFKGESSFAVEMSELRSILYRCDKNSLVLGDELCSGTESISAQSIFASSVISLTKRKVCFVFATHLHELTKLDRIKELDNLGMYHLKVEFDEQTGKLVYDRKLESGSGQAIYGLEVCKAMDMDKEFLDIAYQIRKNILSESEHIMNNKQSIYNAEQFIDKCYICSENAEDVHHIKFQCNADENNMIGHIKKDVKSNLVSLCKKCHLNVHNGDLEIYGYKQTSDGIKLDYKTISKEKALEKTKSRKKYSLEQVEIIKKYIEENRHVPKNYACEKLKTEYNIEISKGTLGKIISGKY